MDTQLAAPVSTTRAELLASLEDLGAQEVGAWGSSTIDGAGSAFGPAVTGRPC
jgi:hypothetical protein